MNQIKNESDFETKENNSSKQVTQYSDKDIIRDLILDIKDKFGIDIEFILIGNNQFSLESTWAKQNNEGKHLTYTLDSLREVKIVLQGIYSALYIKDMSEAEL